MPTLRRELIIKLEGVLKQQAVFVSDGLENESPWKEEYRKLAEILADAALELRGFSFLETDEEQPEYEVKRGFAEWKVKLGEEVSKASIEAAIYAGTKVTQTHVNKQQEVFELETMIDVQLARLPLNWTGFQDKDQDNFRKFLKKQRKEHGRELEKWVNWWMSDEWRVANPPWKLETIKIKWLEAFKNESKPVVEVQTDENDIPKNY